MLGAGVAGLSAIQHAKNLGAIVRAFDVRPAAKEQVRSLPPPTRSSWKRIIVPSNDHVGASFVRSDGMSCTGSLLRGGALE